jgi:hypothetical protein
VLGARSGLVAFAFDTFPERPRPGRFLTASIGVKRLDSGAIVRSGAIVCRARIAGRGLRLVAISFRRSRAVCRWRIPDWAGKRVVRGSVGLRQGPFKVERRFFERVRG